MSEATEKTELVRRSRPAVSSAASAGGDDDKDGPTIKVGEVIDALGVGRFQALLTVFAGLLLLGESMGITLIGIVGRTIQCQWQLPNLRLAIFSLAIFMGFLLFCPLWGFLADQHGRRGVMILGMAFTGYYMLISALSPSFEWLVFLRTVAGAFMATTPQGLVYMVECCPATARAYLLNIGFVVWSVGPVLELAVALGLNAAGVGNETWRILVILSALPIIGSCGAYWLVPETPRFYLVHGQMDKCKASLRHIARVNGRESDFDWDKLRISQEAKTAEAPRVKWLFSRRLRSLTLGLAAISFLTNFTYYGGVLFAQQLVQESGMSNSVAEVLQSSCGGADCRPLSQRDYVNLLVTALSEVPGTVIALSVSAYLERRRMLQVTAGLAGGFTLLLMLSSLAPRSAPCWSACCSSPAAPPW
ncbi:hypothetical protein BOX15_Mlig017804g4 [Macrostomum lignano]|uniref:Major facilitator superfamily (MFS) profile domain-containing protein n=1 Tax=Macrostomum lignano TaxID=282301 RepID=A0A267GHR7_9PLAT|nr:hypothetical protein BOX15_Mlig017804g4 [Macrostomum lignano]